MQQLVILLVISCSSTCFGRLYAHHQEVSLRFTLYGFLSCCICCNAGESGGKMCALCGGSCLSQATSSSQCTHLATPKQLPPHNAHILPPPSNFFLTVHTSCHPQATSSSQCTHLATPKQLPPHSVHILPPDSPTSQKLQQDRKPYTVKRSLTS